MWKRITFHALACPFLLLAQSSINNPYYGHVLKLEIPQVFPSPVVVDSGGTITANTNRNLAFVDFRIQAVDLSGLYGETVDSGYFETVTTTEWSWVGPDPDDWDFVDVDQEVWVEELSYNPVIYEYDSRIESSESCADVNAGVFFFTENNERKRQIWTESQTNIVALTFDPIGVYSNWSYVISPSNFPPYFDQTAEPYSRYSVTATDYSGVLEYLDEGWPVYREWEPSGPLLWYKDSRWNGVESWKRAWTSGEVITGGPYAFLAVGPAPEYTNAIFMNPTSWETNVINSGSIRTNAGGNAYGVTIYPSATHSKYNIFKPYNESMIEWVCQVWNGLDWYRSQETGEPVQYHLSPEWKTKRPTE